MERGWGIEFGGHDLQHLVDHARCTLNVDVDGRPRFVVADLNVHQAIRGELFEVVLHQGPLTILVQVGQQGFFEMRHRFQQLAGQVRAKMQRSRFSAYAVSLVAEALAPQIIHPALVDQQAEHLSQARFIKAQRTVQVLMGLALTRRSQVRHDPALQLLQHLLFFTAQVVAASIATHAGQDPLFAQFAGQGIERVVPDHRLFARDAAQLGQRE